MDNWVVNVRSRDGLPGGTDGDFTVRMPWIPEAKYKCTIRFIAANLTSTVAYALQLRSPALARCLSTAVTNPTTPGDDGWVTAITFSGAQQAAPGVVYFNGAPSLLQARIVVQSTLAVPSTTSNSFMMHFERIADEKNSGDYSAYTVALPDMPEGNYAATLTAVYTNITANAELQVSANNIVRCLTTEKAPTEWVTVLTLSSASGVDMPEGTMYFAAAPRWLSIRLYLTYFGTYVNNIGGDLLLRLQFTRLDAE
ncbi:hypothetical protein JKP88DRAFT_289983 [Tribonema minus]|uniref:Uncharacterized protein n=1 Tax=Tribonema minus TaxID=303371 RepID=A0A835YZ32_9STRA|nr:hypothetical protein JKP88DRAFT_289983 [Tribonema minus]